MHLKRNLTLLSLSLILIACFIRLGYYTNRADTLEVFSLFGAAFLCYYFLIKQSLSLKKIIFGGIALRLVLIAMLPNLSDDYYRFIWDGLLLNNGINPFEHVPSYYINQSSLPIGITKELFIKLNSPDYYTIYPPVCQLSFWIASFFISSNLLPSVIVMRIFILFSEVGILIVFPKILSRLNLNPENIKWYAFNPLVIVELTGNLHYESLMICFLGISLFLLIRKQIVLAAVIFSFSVASKLLPLMFLPLLFFVLEWKKAIKFYIVTGVMILLLFVPFLNQEMIMNMGSSVNLYFQKFEFNASIYYVIRWIGYQVKGYNIIQTAGVRLSYIVVAIILLMSISKPFDYKNLFTKMLFALSIYFFTATIIHPWYI